LWHGRLCFVCVVCLTGRGFFDGLISRVYVSPSVIKPNNDFYTYSE